MKIKIYATSDLHGTLTPFSYSDQRELNVGMMKLSKKIHKDEHTLIIDNGDVLQGSPLVALYQIKHDDIHPMAKVFNALDYDYINIGNHEFNYGKEMVWQFLSECNAKCITSNIFDGDRCMGCDYVIHEFDEEHRIAIIGVCTQLIPIWENPKNIEDMTFVHAFDMVKKQVEAIKEKENVQGIMVVYHGGMEKDMTTGVPVENKGEENLGYRMCQEIEGIDLLITGHQHRTLCGTCFNTCVTQTNFNACEMAYIEWDLDNHTLTPQILKADAPIDWDLYELFKKEEEATQLYLDEPLAHIKEGDLLVHDGFEARVHKHPLVSFINQVQLYFTKADLSGTMLFNEPEGFKSDITMRDLVATYPYPNTLMLLKVNGKILREYLEKNATYFILKDGELAVNPQFVIPYVEHFNYDMVDGCEYTIKVSNPMGSRITELTYKGQPVKDEDEFTLALNNYRAGCGGNFDMFKGCEVLLSLQDDMVETLSKYMKLHPIIEVDHKENIQVIK